MRRSVQPKKGIASHIIKNYVIESYYSSFPQVCTDVLTKNTKGAMILPR